MANVGDACAGCHFSQAIPNMREHDRGKVWCTYGGCRVHANGLCDKYRDGLPTVLVPLSQRSAPAPARPSWRDAIRAATGHAPAVEEPAMPTHMVEVPLDLELPF